MDVSEQDGIRQGNWRRGPRPEIGGENHPRARLTREQALMVISDPRSSVVLAKLLGVSQGTISMIRRGATWIDLPRPAKVRTGIARGEQAGSARLTEAQVLAVRADTRKTSVIAAELGVASPTITRIRKGWTWRWLTGGDATAPKPAKMSTSDLVRQHAGDAAAKLRAAFDGADLPGLLQTRAGLDRAATMAPEIRGYAKFRSTPSGRDLFRDFLRQLSGHLTSA